MIDVISRASPHDRTKELQKSAWLDSVRAKEGGGMGRASSSISTALPDKEESTSAKTKTD